MVTLGIIAPVRNELVFAAIQRANILTDPDIRNDEIKRYNSVCKKIFKDESLTENEKMEAIIIITQDHDYFKVLSNKGEKRLCKDCNKERLATLYCEHCVRIYLIDNFSNWTSGNNIIDNIIQEYQMKTVRPDNIIEWIPYYKLQNIEYLSEGGNATVYSATWVDGRYLDWYPVGQRLIRTGNYKVALKKLKKIENNKWYEEVKLHLKLCNELGQFVACYGLTKDPTDDNYMIVMRCMDADLKKYIREKKSMKEKYTWKDKLNIANDTIKALYMIHEIENAIHRDLHSGNILYSKNNNHWYISDFGLCGAADKSPNKYLFANIPYVAPEIFAGKDYTRASDIYSFGILMWEISSGQTPFYDYDDGLNLIDEINRGTRPKIVPGTPSKYKELMQKCWNADPHERPDVYYISQGIDKMRVDSYKDDSEFNDTLEQDNSNQISTSSSDLSSNFKLFEDYLPESSYTVIDEDEFEECRI